MSSLLIAGLGRSLRSETLSKQLWDSNQLSLNMMVLKDLDLAKHQLGGAHDSWTPAMEMTKSEP